MGQKLFLKLYLKYKIPLKKKYVWHCGERYGYVYQNIWSLCDKNQLCMYSNKCWYKITWQSDPKTLKNTVSRVDDKIAYCGQLRHMVPYLCKVTSKFVSVELCVKTSVYGHLNSASMVSGVIVWLSPPPVCLKCQLDHYASPT